MIRADLGPYARWGGVGVGEAGGEDTVGGPPPAVTTSETTDRVQVWDERSV